MSYVDLLVTGDRERADRAAAELAVATRLLIDGTGRQSSAAPTKRSNSSS